MISDTGFVLVVCGRDGTADGFSDSVGSTVGSRLGMRLTDGLTDGCCDSVGLLADGVGDRVCPMEGCLVSIISTGGSVAIAVGGFGFGRKKINGAAVIESGIDRTGG